MRFSSETQLRVSIEKLWLLYRRNLSNTIIFPWKLFFNIIDDVRHVFIPKRFASNLLILEKCPEFFINVLYRFFSMRNDIFTNSFWKRQCLILLLFFFLLKFDTVFPAQTSKKPRSNMAWIILTANITFYKSYGLVTKKSP